MLLPVGDWFTPVGHFNYQKQIFHKSKIAFFLFLSISWVLSFYEV
jgi:hypothetical protein